MRKIVIACDSYKGCLSSSDVANAAARGVAEVYPDCEVIKLAVVCHALSRVPVCNTVLDYASECDLIWDLGLC